MGPHICPFNPVYEDENTSVKLARLYLRAAQNVGQDAHWRIHKLAQGDLSGSSNYTVTPALCDLLNSLSSEKREAVLLQCGPGLQGWWKEHQERHEKRALNRRAASTEGYYWLEDHNERVVGMVYMNGEVFIVGSDDPRDLDDMTVICRVEQPEQA